MHEPDPERSMPPTQRGQLRGSQAGGHIPFPSRAFWSTSPGRSSLTGSLCREGTARVHADVLRPLLRPQRAASLEAEGRFCPAGSHHE